MDHFFDLICPPHMVWSGCLATVNASHANGLMDTVVSESDEHGVVLLEESSSIHPGFRASSPSL